MAHNIPEVGLKRKLDVQGTDADVQAVEVRRVRREPDDDDMNKCRKQGLKKEDPRELNDDADILQVKREEPDDDDMIEYWKEELETEDTRELNDAVKREGPDDDDMIEYWKEGLETEDTRELNDAVKREVPDDDDMIEYWKEGLETEDTRELNDAVKREVPDDDDMIEYRKEGLEKGDTSEPADVLQVEREVPDDLIAEVLSWLPPDSYCRMKSLSRFLNATLSDPKVLKDHPLVMVLAGSEDEYWKGLIGVESSAADTENLSHWFKFPIPPGNAMEVVGVSQGLVCAYVWDFHKPKPYRYVVFNPITGERVNLPTVSVKKPSIFGFGEVGGKLKVAVFNGVDQALLTLGSDNDWRISKGWDGDPCIGHRDGKYHRGCLYWVARWSRAIIVFHLGGEYFEHIEFEFPLAEKKIVAVGTHGVDLCVAVESKTAIEIYTMGAQKYWEKKRVLYMDTNRCITVLSYCMHGRADRLIILHDQRLGILKKGRKFVDWCNILSNFQVSFQAVYILQPTFHTLQQLGVHFDGGDIESDDAGMSDGEDDEDDGYDLIW